MIVHIPVIILAAALLPLRVLAHHSFSADYDREKPVHLEGEVVTMEWSNPHSWLHVDVTEGATGVLLWRVEGGAPAILLRRGWTPNSLPPGTRIIADGFQARDGSRRINAQLIRLPDGRVLDLASSNRETEPAVAPAQVR